MQPNRPPVRPASARRPGEEGSAPQHPLQPQLTPTQHTKPTGNTFLQRSVGNAVKDELPHMSTSNSTSVSRGAASTLYSYHRKDTTKYDTQSNLPSERSIISRPLSARSSSTPDRAAIHPRPPSMTQAAGSQSAVRPVSASSLKSASTPAPSASRADSKQRHQTAEAVFDEHSPYDFGTATAQVRLDKERQRAESADPIADTTEQASTPFPAPPSTPSQQRTTRPGSAGSLMRSVNTIVSPRQTTCEVEDVCEQKPNESQVQRPSTAKRPQSARAEFEVREAFSAMERDVRLAAASQLDRRGPESVVAPDDRIDISQMKSFEDVVSYYATSLKGNNYTPVKFVHMKRVKASPGQRYMPYHLRVAGAPECKPEEEHFIVSNASVVHAVPGQPPHIQTIAQFTQEASLFSVISKIKFFRTYLIHKMFTMWYKNIRQKYFLSVRAKLGKSFLLGKKTFAAPLRTLHKDLASLQSLPFVKLPVVREGLTLERFQQAMLSQKLVVLDFYRQVMDSVESRLGQLVQELRSAADVPDFATEEAIQQYVVFLEDQAAKKRGEVYNPNAIPITRRKENMRARLSEMRAALEEFHMVPQLIRLIDYIAAETMFYKAMSSIGELTAEITRSDEDKALFFLISVTFGDQGVVFVPAEEELLRVTSDVCEEVIASSVYLPRLVTSKALRGALDDAAPKLQSLSALLRDDARVLLSRGLSRLRIEKDFADGQEATRHFGKNRTWLEFVNKVWPAMLGSWNERFANETLHKDFLDSRGSSDTITVDEFAEVFRKAEEALLSLKEMHAVRRGCLVITSTVVLDFLNAKLKEITAECREKLLAVAKSRLDRVAATLNTRIKLLQERPTHLSKFAAFVGYTIQQTRDVALLTEACEQVEQLYVIAEQNGCEPGQEAGRREVILGRSQDHHGGGGGQSIRGRYEEATLSAKEFVASHMHEMARKLKTELEVEYDSIATYATLADSQVLAIYNSDVSEPLAFLTQLEENMAASETKVKLLLEWQQLFDIPPVDTQVSLHEVKLQVKGKRELWMTIERFHDARMRCYTVAIGDADVPAYAKEVDELYTKTYNRLHPRHQSDASERLLDVLREEKQLMPTLLHLGNRNLKRDHWAKILANQNRAFDPSMTLETMRHMKLFDAFYREVINEQSVVASGEATLLSNLEEIRSKWGVTQFQTKPFKDLKDYSILDDVSDVIQQLEEHQLLIQSCLASRFVMGVRAQVEDWERRLHLLGLVIDEWISVQSSWMYLAFIFVSEDMKRQLPTETSMFHQVDFAVKELIHRVHTFKNCIVVATDAPVLESLKESRASLDIIQKRLEEYLETKRTAFPRFYFLSNDELLSILADVRNPRAVRPHLRKCFDAISDLTFKGDSHYEVTGVLSMDGELLVFPSVVFARGGVEVWLANVDNAVRHAIKANMTTTLQSLGRDGLTRSQWLMQVQNGVATAATPAGKHNNHGSTSFLAQCLQACDAIHWVADVEEAIRSAADDSHALERYHRRYLGTLEDTVKIVRQSLTPLQRSLVQTMLVLNVHNRDVVAELVEERVVNVDSFTWKKQLRSYYSTERSVVFVEHVRAVLEYGYEYLGSAKRLVITPLTDRAFLTCTQALQLHLGAAPQGPAGTGKTESVKDLGKALARHVVVFNCSDGINAGMMSQMFAGLAQAGSWACFDEFNRIELEVLSVIAQQMLEITTAVGLRQTRMTFDGHELELHKNFGVFVTMNPGYAGRTELPDNLQALFRPVCMMIPDYRLIAEIMFFSEGFMNARTLATKMVQLYKLASEQLSKQDHYDFGMRAVKAILVMAGSLKRSEPDSDEDMLLIRAMRDSNLPKFLRDDAQLFMAIVKDLYPNVAINSARNEALASAVGAATCDDLRLSATPRFVDKTLQLFETMVSRFGVMLVGPTLSGKSCSSAALEHALCTISLEDSSSDVSSDRQPRTAARHAHFLPVTRYTINPKAVSRDELYGSVNPTTREWVDGILSHIVRGVCTTVSSADVAPARYWVNFDGPVDAVWIENLNTVLDDNKMLCLVNGERIKLPEAITFLFEVEDLRAASPATVSRCGMVYYDTEVVSWRDQFIAMQQQMAVKHSTIWDSDFANAMLAKVITPTVGFLDEHSLEWIATSHPHRVVSMFALLDSLLANRSVNDDDPPPTVLPPVEVDEDGQELPVDGVIIKGDDEQHAVDRSALFTSASANDDGDESHNEQRLFEMMFLFSYIWAFGGNQCDKASRASEGRRAFSEFALEVIASLDPEFPQPNRADGKEASVFDVCVHKGSLRWVDWAYKVPAFLYRRRVPFGDLLVQTPQSAATSYITHTLLSQKRHVLINGTTGTGKSVTVQNSVLLDRLQAADPSSAWQSFTFVLSARSTGKQLQDTLESHLRKHPSKRKDQACIGPMAGKTLVMFIDDINMPQCDMYGACPTLELLRQLIVQGGVYDKKKCAFKTVQDVIAVACCGPPGGTRTDMSQRLTSKFFMFCQPHLNDASVTRIFGSILKGFLTIFSPDVRSVSTLITKATLDVFSRVGSELLPTPERAHYMFNMRDTGRVVQGLTQTTPRECMTRNDVIQLWVHECFRVFCDRLISDADRKKFEQILMTTASSRLSCAVSPSWCQQLYGDFGGLAELPVYRPLELGVGLQEVLAQKLREYAVQYNKDLDLVLFDDAVRHLARLCRILRQARGNAMLVGVSGSGRQSLAQLAAFLCRCQKQQIQLTSVYDHVDFRKDLRSVLKVAGCDNEPVVFLLSDHQIVNEVFLEDINSLLNTGEITNLWDADDTEIIISSVRDRVRRLKKPETIASMMSVFVTACRDNLHIVLTMSPMGSDLFRRLRTFPSLINCTTIDWYDRWPAAALHSVASKTLSASLVSNMSVDVSDESFDADLARVNDLSTLFVYVHTTVEEAAEDFYKSTGRRAYCTPTSYIGLLQSFSAMLRDQRESSEENIQRFQLGLERLEEANRRVDDMKTALTKLQPELVKSTEETQQFAADVEREQKAAADVAQIVAREEAQCSLMMREAQLIKDDCQMELDKAMPAYNEALDALNALNPKDIQEAKAYITPPKKVEMVMDAVLTVLDESLGWDNAKRALGKPDFVNILRNYDVNSLSEKSLRKLKKFTELDDFKPDAIKNVSKACVSFCLWCRAVENYCDALKILEPKRQKLAIAEAALQKAKAALAEKQAQLAEVEARLERLRRQYEDSMTRLRQLEAEKIKTELHLARAETLLSGLSSEHQRWTASIVELQHKSQYAMSLTALASAFVAYAGVFDASFRDMLLTKWTRKCQDMNFVVDPTKPFAMEDMVDPVMIRHWHVQGLPIATMSIQNAVVVSKSTRWCLCIDPHSQANTWIKNTYKNQGLVVLRMSDANLTRHIEVAVRGGLAVLIEDVGTSLDASLDPVLRRETFRSGGRLMMTVRDQPVEYNPSFFLIMTCRLSNPHFLPEVHVKTTVLNFDVTTKGLEDQLLAEVVRSEKRELEDKADQLLMQVTEARAQLKAIEDQILSMLSNSEGNLLENDVLITTLQQSKQTGADLTAGLVVIQGTSVEIQAAREVYRPVAARGALVFNVIQQVTRLDHMYQTSLTSFLQLFRRTMSHTAASATLDEHLVKLQDNITLASYETTSRALFEKDRSVFRFTLALQIAQSNPAQTDITPASWNYMLRESGGALLEQLMDLPGEWLSDVVWENLQFLSTLEGFKGLAASIAANTGNEWSLLRQNPTVPEASQPLMYQRMSLWNKMLVMRTFSSAIVASLAEDFVRATLGAHYCESLPFDLSVAYAQSTCTTPIAFLLSSGTDPTMTFQHFADKMGMLTRTVMLSLGQGQGNRAEAAINKAASNGQWVFLQNCHVYTSWLPQLSHIVESLVASSTDVHVDFRLWLSTLPSDAFPVSILQSSVKLTREPPRGIKANLRDSLALAAEHDVWRSVPANATGNNQVINWRRLIFSVAAMHAIVQERRKFGPLGWNVPYSWNLTDFENSLRMLQTLCEGEAIGSNSITGASDFNSWAAVYHIIGNVNYGGRVTDLWDNRALLSILMRVVNSSVLSANGSTLTDDGSYRIPANLDGASLKLFVDTLPSQDPPELFGLHSNAETLVREQNSTHLLKSIVALQSGGGSTRALEDVMPVVVELLARLPSAIDLDVHTRDVFAKDAHGVIAPLGNVCLQECSRYNALSKTLTFQLQQCQLALRGSIGLNEEWETLLTSLSFGHVPRAWESIAYPSLKPLFSWITDLVARVDFFRDWVDSGAPSSFWFGGFTFPQGFTTALLQTHSRLHAVPVDELCITSHVTEDIDALEAALEPLAAGAAYVHGLTLEGAKWNVAKHCLEEFAGKEVSCHMPILALVPAHKSAVSKDETAAMFECPVYKVGSRAGSLSTTGISSNFVLSVRLSPGTDTPSHWVERGCALIASTSD